MAHKVILIFILSSSLLILNGCKNDTPRSSEIVAENFKKNLKFSIINSSINNTRNIENFDFDIQVGCQNIYGGNLLNPENIYVNFNITNKNPEFYIYKNTECKIIFEKFKLELENTPNKFPFYPAKKLSIISDKLGILFPSKTTGHYYNESINKYINASGNDDHLNLFISDEPEFEIATSPSKSISLALNNRETPRDFELVHMKSSYNSKSFYTVYNSSNLWPKDTPCKIINPGIDPISWNIVDIAFKQKSNVDCSKIILGEKNNWNLYHMKNISIILANSSNEYTSTSYQVIQLDAF